MMNKSGAIILTLCALTLSAGAQGTFVIDSGANVGDGSGPTATTGGLVWIDGVVDTTTDINLGVLWGTSPTSVTTALNIDPLGLNAGSGASSGNWLANQGTGAGDMTSYGGGAIFDPNGNTYVVPGAAAGSTIWLVLQGWTGNSVTFGGAGVGAQLETAPFSIVLAANTSRIQPDTHTMGAMTQLIPEPSVPMLSALATLAFAHFRRRK